MIQKEIFLKNNTEYTDPVGELGEFGLQIIHNTKKNFAEM